MTEIRFEGGPLDGMWCDTTQGSVHDWDPPDRPRPRLTWWGDERDRDLVRVENEGGFEYVVMTTQERGRRHNHRMLLGTPCLPA